MVDQHLPNPNILKRPFLVATQFGVPNCILDWEDALMSLLPTSVGNSLLKGVTEGIAAANQVYADVLNGLFGLIGVTVFDSKTGQFMWEREQGEGEDTLGPFTALFGLAAFLAQGYNNYVTTAQQIQSIKDCLEEIKAWKDSQDDPDDEGLDREEGPIPSLAAGPGDADRALITAQAATVAAFLQKALAWQEAWGRVLAARAADSSLEPVFNIDTDGMFLYASATAEQVEPIFDLVYGPPLMKEGQLIMSRDGLYYNSQSETYTHGGDIPDRADIGFVPLPEAWKMNHFPSLGGKGQSYTMQDLDTYVDTLFDANQIDSGEDIQEHYKADHLLKVVEGQKTKEVYDVSTQINSLVASGYEPDSAMVINLKQTLYSTISSFNKKINKRKKQIEVAVKAPDLYGSSSFSLGEVPINDFSFLKNINLAVDVKRQTALTFEQGEVSSIVLPLRPKYVRGVDSEGVPLLKNLVVPPVGIGAIQHQTPEDTEFSSVGKVVSLTDDIVTDNLFAIYSFLQGKVVKPTSKEYQVLNCVTKDNYNNCQLVGASSQDVYASGLGIPFLRGIPKVGFNTTSRHPNISGVGSYLKMPNTKEFQNLLYNPRGASIDFWMHMPNLGKLTRPYNTVESVVTDRGDGSWSTYQYHKLLLACENTGGKNLNQTDSEIILDRSSDVVRGFVMGFSRENLLVNAAPQSLIEDSDELGVTNRMVFYMAPTQSVNQKNVAFINKGACYTPNNGIHKMIIPVEKLAAGLTLKDSKTQFVHVNVSFDVHQNEVRVYLDGNHLETSAISEVFGVEAGEAPQLPSFYKTTGDSATSSFTYAKGEITQVDTVDFDNGPSLEGFFTPWIVGGGWTDGIPAQYDPPVGDESTTEGGFMASNHGYKSGLDGFIGSLKFYSKPLNKDEVFINFSNQQVFFKNIKT